MILGTKARYAVMAMADLAGRHAAAPVPITQLAESQEITVPYLEQIFSKLKQRGLLKSVRGPGGGYVLARPASEMPISDIVEAVEESIKMTRCESHGTAGCMARKERCITHHLWEGLSQQIYDYLNGISLEDVCERRLGGQIRKHDHLS